MCCSKVAVASVVNLPARCAARPCRQQAQPSAVGKLLTFNGGLVDASYQKAACVRCGREVLGCIDGCMDIAADLGLLLRCDPAAVDIFPILAPRHNDDGRSPLFVETRRLLCLLNPVYRTYVRFNRILADCCIAATLLSRHRSFMQSQHA